MRLINKKSSANQIKVAAFLILLTFAACTNNTAKDSGKSESPTQNPDESTSISSIPAASPSESENMIAENKIQGVPGLQLSYTVNDRLYEVAVSVGTYEWKLEEEDGIIMEEATGLHPLDAMEYMPKIEKPHNPSEVGLHFEIQPETYTIRRWPDEYVGEQQAYEQYFEIVDISDNTISLPHDEDGYVYEVYATWQQGNAYYAFYIG